MLVIRLTRIGKKKQPTYRLVVQDKHKDPWGKALDIVGSYNPLTKPKTLKLEADKIKGWIAKGAQPTATVNNLLVGAGVITTKKMRATTGDKPKAVEEKK